MRDIREEQRLEADAQMVTEKYGFYNTDNAVLCSDGYCWCCCVNLAKCQKEKTGERIILKNHLFEGRELSCEAEIYKLIWNEEEYKYSGITEEMELYVAIGDLGMYGWSLISIKNKYFDEALRIINEGVSQKKSNED